MHSNRNANIHEKSLNYTFTLNCEDFLEKLKVLQVRVSEPGVSDGKPSCLHPEAYPINQHVVSSVSIQLMPCIYGFSIQIIKTSVLAFSEIWVSHPFTLLNQLKDVELTEYWSTGITSPAEPKLLQSRAKVRLSIREHSSADIHSQVTLSVCPPVWRTPCLAPSLLFLSPFNCACVQWCFWMCSKSCFLHVPWVKICM